MTQNSPTITPLYAGEMQLAGWSESHTGGCKVTFWLSGPDELAAFRALTVRKGNTSGHRMMAVFVEIGDNEEPVPPPVQPVEKPSAPHLGDACYRTVQWCADPQFWDWINSTTHGGVLWHIDTEIYAKEFVCEICGVTSRKELDTNNEANKAWHRLIREPYRLYLLTLPPVKGRVMP